jgi:MFS family permease
LSPSAGWLIASRVVQGISAALLTPASLALIGATFPKSERTGAIGVWAAASALTSAAGPVVGGWLTDRFGWQAIFWINPPIALVADVLLRVSVTADPRQRRRPDVVGAGLIAGALGALTWALSEIGRPAATEFAVGAVVLVGALGLAGLCAYAAWERVSPHPMTPPRLADNRIFVGLNAATLLLYSGLSIMFFLLPFELIDRRHLSPTAAGLAFLPFTLGVGLLSRLFGGLADQFGARPLLITGAAGASVAYVWMALAQHGPLVAAVIAPQALLGISFAVLVAPLTGSVMSSVPKSDEGLASGVNNTASRIAQLAGVALATAFGTVDAGYRYGLWVAAVVSVVAAVTTSLELPPLPKKKQERRS